MLCRKRYGSARETGRAIDAYNERFRGFRACRACPSVTGATVAQRLRSADALHGRDGLHGLVKTLGFRME